MVLGYDIRLLDSGRRVFARGLQNEHNNNKIYPHPVLHLGDCDESVKTLLATDLNQNHIHNCPITVGVLF